MKKFTYIEQDTYKICILSNTLDNSKNYRTYIKDRLDNDTNEVIIYKYEENEGKVPVALAKEYCQEFVQEIQEKQVKYVLCANAQYFKTLTKLTKAEPYLGILVPCTFDESILVTYVPNTRAYFYDPDTVKSKIDLSMNAVIKHVEGNSAELGTDIIKYEEYPTEVSRIAYWLNLFLEDGRELSVDIETFSLKFYEAGIGTITFCWNQHEGIAFAVDLSPHENKIRNLLKDFFIRAKQKIKYHNAAFDVTVLIYQLFMTGLSDYEGMLEGIDVMCRNIDCTYLITYLATNTCAGNNLSLKDQSHEYSGNYAIEEISDIRLVPLDKLLKYNLIDGISTWYVYNKNYPVMISDQQLSVYETIFLPALTDIIQMQLTGMPLDAKKVQEVKEFTEATRTESLNQLLNTETVKLFTNYYKNELARKKNQKLKVKRVTADDMEYQFNPDSPNQLADLLFNSNFLGLVPLSKTKTGNPATGNKDLVKLLSTVEQEEVTKTIQAIIDYKDANKILTTFIPAFENAPVDVNSNKWLFGNFKLGGTKSGRLSSSDINLQNLPAGGKYGKAIKDCFVAPDGWLVVGLDFNALEDRISALTTKDPNKLKVYIEGYDSHSLRAFSYFRDQMPDIEDNLNSINSISEAYPILRSRSKGPTFALTYQGTYHTLIKNCGFTREEAISIEDNFRKLYKVSIDYVDDKLRQASIDGYVTLAFGLRLRTPLLKQVVYGSKSMPYEAAAEGRTAGNALGQSYGLLNNRACTAFMKLVRASKHRYSILPIAHIHDAQYYLVKNDADPVMYMNTYLVKEVQWQEDPNIYHPDVHLGGELSIFYPSWKYELSLPNNLTTDELFSLVQQHTEKLDKQ